jgi:hypothetical protein
LGTCTAAFWSLWLSFPKLHKIVRTGENNSPKFLVVCCAASTTDSEVPEFFLCQLTGFMHLAHGNNLKATENTSAKSSETPANRNLFPSFSGALKYIKYNKNLSGKVRVLRILVLIRKEVFFMISFSGQPAFYNLLYLLLVPVGFFL